MPTPGDDHGRPEPADQAQLNKIPRGAGYSLQAAGTNKDGKTVMWEAIKDGTTAWYLEGTAKAVKNGHLLPPEHTSCTIPAGIFHGTVSITLTAYSTDARGGGAMTALGWAQSTTMLMITGQ